MDNTSIDQKERKSSIRFLSGRQLAIKMDKYSIGKKFKDTTIYVFKIYLYI